MQTQSRLIVNANGGSVAAAADYEQYYEAVVRELRRGQELTGQLQTEALPALRGQGQAEATAASILREVSRAFTVCISIMGGSAPAANAPPLTIPGAAAAAAGAPRARDDGVPRKRTTTTSPHSDGYEWRKYGQKRIMRTSFPRCYYKCSYHRERSCPATKQVQEQPSNGGPKTYVVIYVHDHTCDHASPAKPEAAAGSAAADQLDFSTGLSLQVRGGVVQLSKGEIEQQALVSSLACVLQGSQSYSGGESSSQGLADDDGASAAALWIEASTELPMLFDEDKGLDVMDYGVTDAPYFVASSSYGPDDDMLL